MNIPRFTITGYDQNTQNAEVMSDDNGAWVLYLDVVYEIEQLKRSFEFALAQISQEK